VSVARASPTMIRVGLGSHRPSGQPCDVTSGDLGLGFSKNPMSTRAQPVPMDVHAGWAGR
jgi:hypothetical protein